MNDIKSYVVQAAALQELALDTAALERIATVLTRNAEMARLLAGFEMDESQEPAAVFRAAV